MKDVTTILLTVVGVGVALGTGMILGLNGIRTDIQDVRAEIRQVESGIEELRSDFREDVVALRTEFETDRREQQDRILQLAREQAHFAGSRNEPLRPFQSFTASESTVQ